MCFVASPQIALFIAHHSAGQLTQETRYSWFKMLIPVLILVFLALLVYRLHQDSIAFSVVTVLSILFLSVEWWENFIPVKDAWKKQRRKELSRMRRQDRHSAQLKGKIVDFKAGSLLFRIKYAIRDRRTKIETMCSLWKLLLNLVIPTVVFAAPHAESDCASALFFRKDEAQNCTMWRQTLHSGEGGWCQSYLPFIVAAVSILASVAAFKAVKVSCKIHAQKLCFGFPLLLSAPLTLVVVLVTYRQDLVLASCSKLYWPKLPHGVGLLDMLEKYTEQYWLPLVFLGLLVLAASTMHVWKSSVERVATTDK